VNTPNKADKAEAPLPLDIWILLMKVSESENRAVWGLETATDLTERAAELLSAFDRELKYEVLEVAVNILRVGASTLKWGHPLLKEKT
jgi:hypothetical protein